MISLKAKELKPITNYAKEQLETIVCKTLKKYGGFANGFCTYVQGKVTIIRSHTVMGCSLRISTPSTEDCTGKELREAGQKLYDTIHKFLLPYDLESVEFIASVQEHGVFYTSMRFTYKSYNLELSKIRYPRGG